jgi:hypothetical protein
VRLLLVLLAALASLLPPSLYSSCISLTWTASGDDGYLGTADKYDVRYSVNYLTEQNWDQATRVDCRLKPKPSGQREDFMVSDLEAGQMYYFAIKVGDEAGNWSPLSNVIAKIGPPDQCTGTVGNADCSEDDLVTIGDIAILINHLFLGGPLCCVAESNVDGDPGGVLSIGDISTLIDYLFIRQRPLPTCGS